MAEDDKKKVEELPDRAVRMDPSDAEEISAQEDDLENEEGELAEESALPLGLSGEEELEEIYEQRGGGEAQRAAEMRRPVETREVGGGVPAHKLSSAEQLFGDTLVQRASHAGERLHAAMRGTVLVSLQDSGRSYLVDWSGDCLRSEFAENPAQCVHDCRIYLRENDLLAVANGELNPQIGMLSHKINVTGRSDLAVYFFNLLGS